MKDGAGGVVAVDLIEDADAELVVAGVFEGGFVIE